MRSILLVAVLAGMTGRLSAQAPQVLRTGTRVRILSLGEGGCLDQRAEGTVERISGDTLTINQKIGGVRPIYVGHAETRRFV